MHAASSAIRMYSVVLHTASTERTSRHSDEANGKDEACGQGYQEAVDYRHCQDDTVADVAACPPAERGHPPPWAFREGGVLEITAQFHTPKPEMVGESNPSHWTLGFASLDRVFALCSSQLLAIILEVF